MLVRLARLRPPTLSHFSTQTFAEGNQLVDICTNAIGNTNDQFEIAANACQVAGFLQELKITIGVGVATCFLIGIGCWKHYFGSGRRLRQEHVLHYYEGFLYRERIDVVAGDRIRSSYV